MLWKDSKGKSGISQGLAAGVKFGATLGLPVDIWIGAAQAKHRCG